MLPESIQKFIDIFSRLPSIGPRQATRLAFRLIRWGPTRITELRNALDGITRVKICSQCFFIHTNNDSLCSLCTDEHRTQTIFMIVEKETDLISIERTGKYKGLYLILGDLTRSGVLDKTHKMRIETLQKTITALPSHKAQEIIIALNPTTYGDLHASILNKELSPFAQKITRLGRGIPTGGEIEFADAETLEHSLERRN
jgi:recombination protein RecR